MAAKDHNGKLQQTPGLILESSTQLRRFCEGKAIRKMSLEKRRLLKGDLKDLTHEELKKMLEGERVQCILE
jgi:hypothetical protein